MTESTLETSFENHIPPRLLIIPVGNVSAIDIMEQEEEIGEFLPQPSDKCFLKRRTTIKRPDFLPGDQAQLIWSIPSNTGSYHDYQKYLGIIKLDDSTDSLTVLPENEYHEVPMLIKRNRTFVMKPSETNNNSVDEELAD